MISVKANLDLRVQSILNTCPILKLCILKKSWEYCTFPSSLKRNGFWLFDVQFDQSGVQPVHHGWEIGEYCST